MINKEKGMTLIELMIVVAIVAIIGMVAYPSYMDSVRKTRKADAVATINKIMQAQERYFVNNLTYTSDLTDLGFSASSDLPSEEGFYKATAEACAGDTVAVCINIITTAQGSQATGNSTNDNIGLDSRGVKTGKWPNDR